MRHNSKLLFSPLVDLFAALALIFLVLLINANKSINSLNQQLKQQKQQKQQIGNKVEWAISSRGGIFKYSSSAINIESAPFIKQLFLNSFKDLRKDWSNGLENATSYYRIVANSDHIHNPISFNATALGTQRAVQAMSLGFESELIFENDLYKGFLDCILNKNPNKKNIHADFPQDKEANTRLNWLYANNYSKKYDYDNEPTAYLLLWPKQKVKKYYLFKMVLSGISLYELPVDSIKNTTLYPMIEYRIKGNMAVAFKPLYNALKLSSELSSPIELRGTESPLDSWLGENGINAANPNYRAYLPFFQIASRCSYDSLSFGNSDFESDCQRELENQVNILKDVPSAQLKTRFHEMLGIDSKDTPIRKKQYNKSFLSRNENIHKFLIGCQRNRAFIMQQIKCESDIETGAKVVVSMLHELKKDFEFNNATFSSFKTKLTSYKDKSKYSYISDRLSIYNDIKKEAKKGNKEFEEFKKVYGSGEDG